MKVNRLFAYFGLIWFIAACSVFRPPAVVEDTAAPTSLPANTATDTATVPPSPTMTQTAVPTVTATPTPAYPEEGYGPTGFPADVNPLSGLRVADASLLDHRPVAIKVNIVPRTGTRPPWGLSAADIVYEYYHNDGYTRFHAIYNGEDADIVGPIRSARLPDASLVPMYESIYAYGSADERINSILLSAGYGNRLILEGGGQSLCPATDQEPLCRFDPNGYDYLLGGTKEIRAFAEAEGIDNSRQDLEGMFFQLQAPQGGETAGEVTTRFSADSYHSWDYDPESGIYQRSQDNLYALDTPEEFAPLLDRNAGEQIGSENVVVLLMTHSYYQKPPSEIIDIQFTGSGPAYAFRDGQAYEVQWNVPAQGGVLYLTGADGKDFPLKPGSTWFEVLGEFSEVTQPEDGAWRFNFIFP